MPHFESSKKSTAGFSFLFVRVHHSYLINLNEVTKYIRGEGGYLVVSDGSSVNVSRSRKESLMKYFWQGSSIFWCLKFNGLSTAEILNIA